MTKKRITKILLLTSILMVIGLIFYWVLLRDATQNSIDGSENISDPETQTTSDAPTAQPNFTDGDDRQPSGRPEGEGSGTVTDNQGNIDFAGSQDQWKTSSTGDITIYSPTGGKLVSGDKISGESALNRVNFRLIDDVTGVISQGSLNVVNGKFSGTFDFFTNGKEGRLDVYGSESDGREFSNIEIPILFK